jgi:hypothetical protein
LKKRNSLRKFIEERYVNITMAEIVPTDNLIAPSELKREINYYFGVPEKELNKTNTLGELINLTKKFPVKNSEFYKNLEMSVEEILNTSKNYLIQNPKINSNPNLVGRYLPSMFGL